MKRFFVLIILMLPFTSGQAPATKKEYLDRRAVILRQIAEVKAKMSALESELQILEEQRPADIPPPPSPTAWREEPSITEGTVRKPVAGRCVSVTRDGKRCSRSAEAGGKYCWQHRNH